MNATHDTDEQEQNAAPLEMYVAVEAYKPTDDAEISYDPTMRVFTYPFATREEAEREAEGMREALKSDETPEMAWYHVDVQRILVPLDRDYDQMDADSYEKLRKAAGAVAEGLVATEAEQAGDRR